MSGLDENVDWFIDSLCQYDAKAEAIVWKEQSYRYGWLCEKLDKWYSILSEQNIQSGDVVALESDYSPDAIALFLALIKNTNIIVPLSSLTVDEKEEFIEIAQTQHRIVANNDGTWNWFKPVGGQVPNRLLQSLREKQRAGLVLFSSGSTGKSKGILHDLTKLLQRYRVKRQALRTITFLLLDHIGGINTLFHVLRNGGTIVTIEERSPSCVCGKIEKHKVELLPTSPTFLNLLLLSEEYKNHDLSSLKLITYGTEPMMESTLINLHAVLPHVKLLQTYGLSELGILRSKSKSDDSKWFKIGGEGFDIKIINNELLIKTTSSMLGYLNAPDPFDEDGYFHTGDIVEVDGEYVKILGRDSDVINVGGQKVFPAEVENLIMQMKEVKDVVVYGEKNPITGHIVIAKVVPSADTTSSAMKKNIYNYCKNKLSDYKIPVKVLLTNEPQFSSRYKKMRRDKNEDRP